MEAKIIKKTEVNTDKAFIDCIYSQPHSLLHYSEYCEIDWLLY